MRSDKRSWLSRRIGAYASVIADDSSEEIAPARNTLPIDADCDFPLIEISIRKDRPGSDTGGMSDNAIIADDRIGVDKSMRHDSAIAPDNHVVLDHCMFSDLRSLTDLPLR